MDFLIADTFTDSLAKLSGDEQKSVKTTAFALRCICVTLKRNSGFNVKFTWRVAFS